MATFSFTSFPAGQNSDASPAQLLQFLEKLISEKFDRRLTSNNACQKQQESKDHPAWIAAYSEA